MNAAAKSTMEGIPEVGIGYGVSDEFRYLFPSPPHLHPPPPPPSFLFFFLGGLHLGEEEIQADGSDCCVVVLCLDDRVSFLSVERGNLTYKFFLRLPPLFLHFLPFYERKKKYIFFFSNLTPRAGRPDRPTVKSSQQSCQRLLLTTSTSGLHSSPTSPSQALYPPLTAESCYIRPWRTYGII